MTTAARPTFDPAKGSASEGGTKAPSLQYSARDQTAHTRLKTRQPGQHSVHETQDKEALKELLLKKEEKNKSLQLKDETTLADWANEREAKGDSDRKHDSSGSLEDAESLESDEDEDDSEALLLELEKIKAERAKAQQAKEVQRQAEAEASVLVGNPLLHQPSTSSQQHDFMVKRRWDDDVVFKNQAKKEEAPKKRFINDVVRSDFHRKFMDKYVR